MFTACSFTRNCAMALGKQMIRILEEGDRMYLNCFGQSSYSIYSEMVSHNYIPDNVPLDAKFILEQFTNLSSSQAQISHTDNFVVSNCDLPKSKLVEPNEAKQSSNEAIQMPNEAKKRPTRQIKFQRGKSNVRRGKSNAQRGT